MTAIPLSFFAEPSPERAMTVPGGYLLLSEAYRSAATRARSACMPVVQAIDHHLAMLTAPALVAAALERLLHEIGVADG